MRFIVKTDLPLWYNMNGRMVLRRPKYGGRSMNLKERAKKLKTDIPAVFIALKKKETPAAAKIAAALTVAYALSPVDLIPDFIPILGYLDDLIILPALVALTIRLIPPDVLAACRNEADNLGKRKTKRWYFALPVVLIWLLIVYLIAKALWFNAPR